MAVTTAQRAIVQPFDQATRLEWARQALKDAATAPSADGKAVPSGLAEPDGWRWRILGELNGLSTGGSAAAIPTPVSERP